MKPTSIILLVFSVVLIVFGIFVCSTATSMAEKQGIELFYQSTDDKGNLLTTYPIRNEIRKVSLDLIGTDVNLIGGADETRIELVNFKINTFTQNETEDTISISNNTDILSLLNLNGKGEQFHGLRHYRNLKNLTAGKASVNIYISDYSALESIEINNVNASIFAAGVSAKADYSFSLKSGKIEFSNCKGAKKLDLNIAGEGSVSVRGSTFTELSAGIENGDFQLNSMANASQTSYSLKTEDGSVSVNSEIIGTSYSISSPAADTSVSVNLVKGDIFVVDMQN